MIEKRKPESPEERAKRIRDRELNDLRVVVSTPEGRRFVWRAMSEGRIFRDGYIPGDSGYGTTYNSGRRSVGTWLLSEVLASKPEVFMQMQREHASEAKREEMANQEYNDSIDPLEVKK